MRSHRHRWVVVASLLMACDSGDSASSSTQPELHTEAGAAAGGGGGEEPAPDSPVVATAIDPVAGDDDSKPAPAAVRDASVGTVANALDDDAGSVVTPAPSASVVDPEAATDCAVQTLILARSGTTSSCGFELPPVSIDTSFLNVIISPHAGDRRVVCRVGGSGSCADSRGWFDGTDEVALCDETCGQFNDYPDALLIAEWGCSTSFCRDYCGNFGESCAAADNCCPGFSCVDGACTPCTAAGDSCSSESAGLCCSETCSDERCCYDFGAPCATDDDCCQGQCVDAACGCAAPTALCEGACVDVSSDALNCGECGNACADGASCVDGTCGCDESSLFYCDGDCVDVASDSLNCGACGSACPEDQQCAGGVCACSAGLVQCSGQCVDLDSDHGNCGECGAGCSSLHECRNGTCECRSDLLLCEGSCIDPMTSNVHCGECGNQCKGQRRCTTGSCQ